MSMNFLNDRICFNCLTQSVDNAKEIIEAMEGHVVVGLLSASYQSTEEAIADINKYQAEIDNNVSVGLGQGNPKFWRRVADISKAVQPKHINQVFTATGFTRGHIGSEEPFINSLVSPTGKPGYVRINTGEQSSNSQEAIIPVETAVLMAKEMGANSIKFFNMHGLKAKEELKVLSEVCAKHNFAVEPTGGIDLDNFHEIVKTILDAGVTKVIPHVYSSIVDKKTGLTNINDIKKIYTMMQDLTQ